MCITAAFCLLSIPSNAGNPGETELTEPTYAEIITTAGITTASLLIRFYGYEKNTPPHEHSNTIDYRIDHYFPSRLNRPLGITADVFNWGAPIAGLSFMAFSAFNAEGQERIRRKIIFMRFWEGYAATTFTTQIAKISVQRPRPGGSDNASFFSGHASAGFYCASFLTGYTGDMLSTGPLHSSSASVRIVAGYVLPGTALYGMAALTAFARIRNHKHYFTDVLTGSLVGMVIGNLAYWVFTPRSHDYHGAIDAVVTAGPDGMIAGARYHF